MGDIDQPFRTFNGHGIPVAELFKMVDEELTQSLEQRRKNLNRTAIGWSIATVATFAVMLPLTLLGGWPLTAIATLGVSTAGMTEYGMMQGVDKKEIPRFAVNAATKIVDNWVKELSLHNDDDVGSGTCARLIDHLAEKAARPYLEKLKQRKPFFPKLALGN